MAENVGVEDGEKRTAGVEKHTNANYDLYPTPAG
jgi:hypothetical protein